MIKVLVASADYEIRTSIRTRMLWIAGIPLACLGLLLAFTAHRANASPTGHVADAAVMMNLLAGLGLSLAAADRFRCQHRPGLADMLKATPGSPLARLIGTLVGSVAATLVPMAVALLIFGAVTAESRESFSALGASLAAIPLILIPGGFAVAALSALAGLVLPVIVARIAVIVVWGWATVLNSRTVPLPTISYSVFSPADGFPAAAWLGGSRNDAVLNGTAVSGLDAALNILIAIACAVAFLVIARWWTELDR